MAGKCGHFFSACAAIARTLSWRLLALAASLLALADPIEATGALATSVSTTGSASFETLRPRIAELARPHTALRPVGLVDRPVVLDFKDHSLLLGLRSRHDERPEPQPAPGAPSLLFQVRSVRREAFADYRKKVGNALEVGIRLPLLDLKETRPSRILPLATPPFFTLVDDIRSETGLGDVTLSIAHAANRPGLSRKLGIDAKLSTGSWAVPDARSLPLGSGQTDGSISYAIKRTRGRVAWTASAGVDLRAEGRLQTLAGKTIRFEPGDGARLGLRLDRRIESWWTASLAADASASGRDRMDGAEQPGSTRQLVTLAPIVTYQASPVFEVILQASLSVVAHGLPDAPEYGVSLRWRY